MTTVNSYKASVKKVLAASTLSVALFAFGLAPSVGATGYTKTTDNNQCSQQKYNCCYNCKDDKDDDKKKGKQGNNNQNHKQGNKQNNQGQGSKHVHKANGHAYGHSHKHHNHSSYKHNNGNHNGWAKVSYKKNSSTCNQNGQPNNQKHAKWERCDGKNQLSRR